MTTHIKIQGIVPRIQYVADGSLATYTFPFAIFSADDIEVYLNNTKQESTAYSVSGVRDSDGGSITFNTAPAADTVITIIRHLSIERTSDFQEGGALRADTLNDELDYQIACQQQIAENLNRSMVLPPYAVNTDVDLTLPTPSAGKAIVWNADGTNLENSTVSVNALESTLRGYKETAESAASTATTKAGIASDKADIATQKATEASAAAENKANKDLDNLSTAGKGTASSFSMPSNTYVDLTVGSNGDTYTAPANGWYDIEFNYGTNSSVGLYKITEATNWQSDTTKQIFGVQMGGSTANWSAFIVPVRKNDLVGLSLSGTQTFTRFRFIYAEGEV